MNEEPLQYAVCVKRADGSWGPALYTPPHVCLGVITDFLNPDDEWLVERVVNGVRSVPFVGDRVERRNIAARAAIKTLRQLAQVKMRSPQAEGS